MRWERLAVGKCRRTIVQLGTNRPSAHAIDEARKMGVENKGLCLLLAYALASHQALAREEVAELRESAKEPPSDDRPRVH